MYSDVVNWCYSHLSDSHVLVLDLDDVYMLQYESDILNIINDENDGMISEGEDDWIISQETKSKILDRFRLYNPKKDREKRNS